MLRDKMPRTEALFQEGKRYFFNEFLIVETVSIILHVNNQLVYFNELSSENISFAISS